MESSREPVAFIVTRDPDAVKTFFVDVMGLELRETSPYALVFSDAGQELRVQIVSNFQPAPFTVHGWRVSDIAHESRALRSKGVEFLRFDGLTQDDQGIWTTPDGNKIAWFTDPSGNILSLTEHT